MITITDLTVRVGAFALENISMHVPQGGYGVLMGRTGTGKTTLLEAIAGLKAVVHGTIALGGEDVTRVKPALRGVGLVPQEGALFQTMSVAENLGFALDVRKVARQEIDKRVGELAEMLGIAPLLGRRPSGLSGGEKQRVALGRALAAGPRILLLDEPLSAVDDETREEMYRLLKSVQASTGVTTVHITHNQEEATRLATQLYVLRDGQIVEPKG